MSAPSDLKDSMFAQLQQAQLAALHAACDAIVDGSYDARVSSVQPGGFSQSDIDSAVAASKDALKIAVKASLQSMEASEEAAIDSL